MAKGKLGKPFSGGLFPIFQATEVEGVTSLMADSRDYQRNLGEPPLEEGDMIEFDLEVIETGRTDREGHKMLRGKAKNIKIIEKHS